MAIPRLLLCGLAALGLLAWSGAARAAEMATIPYAKLDEVWQRIDQIDQKKLAVMAQIRSKNKEVKPAAITMTIKSASGDIPIRIGPEGDILDFPRNETLRKENPLIESNQPKGSLQLTLDLGLAVPPTNSFPYARLMEGVAEANKVVKSQAGLLAIAAPNMKAVTFVFPQSAAGKATVEIVSGKVRKVATADAAAQVKMVIDQKIAAANPEVKVSEKPLRILLNSD